MAQRNDQPNRRSAVIALGVVVLLFVIGLLLTRELYSSGKLEDCLMSGRTNCAPVDGSSR